MYFLTFPLRAHSSLSSRHPQRQDRCLSTSTVEQVSTHLPLPSRTEQVVTRTSCRSVSARIGAHRAARSPAQDPEHRSARTWLGKTRLAPGGKGSGTIVGCGLSEEGKFKK